MYSFRSLYFILPLSQIFYEMAHSVELDNHCFRQTLCPTAKSVKTKFTTLLVAIKRIHQIIVSTISLQSYQDLR